MKKGFTLVELLAVIVVLSVVALITTPMILKVVNQAKIGSYENSVLGYIEAIETSSMLGVLDEESYADGNYKIEDAILKKVKYKGKGPDEGIVSLKQGKVVKGEFCYHGYSITYKNSKATYEKDKNYCQKNYNYEIILNVDGNQFKKEIGIQNSTKFEVDSNHENDWTHISCNNGALPSYENGTVTIDEITESTVCQITSSIQNTIETIDQTVNNIVMLKNETINNVINVPNHAMLNLELNGYTIQGTLNEALLYINHETTFNLTDQIGRGKIVNTTNDVLGVRGQNNTIQVKVNLESGRSAVRMYSNGLNTKVNMIDSETICTGTVDGCLYLTTSSQTLHVKNSKIRSGDYATVVNNSGEIMIDDSQLYGNAEHSNVRNRGTGMITIRNSYIENRIGYGIATNDSSSLTIEGEEVTFNADHRYESGMYVYAPSSHNIYNTSLGTIEVKGGTMESASGIWTNRGTIIISGGNIQEKNGSISFGTSSYGNIYITGGTLTSSTMNVGIGTNSTGKIYICGGSLSAPNNIISRGENGYIYYKSSGIQWNNGTNPSITGEFPQNVIVDDSMVCNP